MLSSLATVLLLAGKLEFVVPDANFSLREGLPAVRILSLHQDKHGALWVGTAAGLAELGGPTIATFGPEQGLSRSPVFAVAEDTSGAIVVGTAAGIFRRSEDRFEPVPLPSSAAQLGVRRFCLGPDGGLWALAGDRLILRQLADQWTAVGIDDALAFEADDLAVDEGGALWLATRGNGLLRLTPEGTRFRRSAQFQAAGGSSVAIDHVASVGGKTYFTSARGLSVVSLASGGAVDTVPFPKGMEAGQRSLAMSAGRVVVGTDAGVFSLKGRALVPQASRNDRARAATTTLLLDREGHVWMGTAEAGLNLLLSGHGVRFLRAGKESFRSIHIDRRGVHWVSNESRLLHFRTDDSGNPVAEGEGRVEGFDSSIINGIAEDAAGGLLFAMEGGVGVLSAADRASASPVIQQDPRFEALRDRLVTAIHRDSSGASWAISPVGVFQLERGGREASRVPYASGSPWMAVMEAQGLLWVATREGALDLIQTATGRLTKVDLPGRRQVEVLAAFPDGGVVVSFQNGECEFFSASGPGGEVVSSRGPSSIPWISVLSLQKMGDRYLAAHGGDRVSQIRLAEGEVEGTLLTSADLEDSDFRYLKLQEGRASQLWFTLPNGIGLFEPPNAPPPPGRLRLDPDLPSVVLNPRPNSIDLHPQLSDPVAPGKTRYRFRLVGETDLWSPWSSDPHIPLSNVAPGTYLLQVEAEDRYGRRANRVSIEVTAKSRLWESWPFRAAASLLALGAVYALYRWRVRSIERERLDLAAAVQAGRADLEVANQRLQELSLTDMLTGLRNRRYFSEVVDDELRLLRRRFDERGASGDENRDALFFLLDLDHFKTVNDLFGHAGGDAVLVETARRLEGFLRRTDRLIRWGGEEFLVVSLDSRRSEAPEMAARMMSAISLSPYPVGPPGGAHLSTSLGFAAYPFLSEGFEPQAEDLVRLADRALYRAKRGGRNCAVGISPAHEPVRSGTGRAATVELVPELGISVRFTIIKGPPRDPSRSLASLRGSGPVARLS